MYSRWTRSKSLGLPDSGLFFFVVNSELLWNGTLFCGLFPEHQIHWKPLRVRQCNKKATTWNIGKFLNIAGCWTLGGSITTSMQVSRHNKHLIFTFQGRRMIPRQRYLPETLSCPFAHSRHTGPRHTRDTILHLQFFWQRSCQNLESFKEFWYE